VGTVESVWPGNLYGHVTFIKQELISALSKPDFVIMYTLRRYRFLADVGWFENWRTKQSIDGPGNPISWIAYPCLSFLSPWIDPRLEVFEL
jgi:hypothetical protein